MLHKSTERSVSQHRHLAAWCCHSSRRAVAYTGCCMWLLTCPSWRICLAGNCPSSAAATCGCDCRSGRCWPHSAEGQDIPVCVCVCVCVARMHACASNLTCTCKCNSHATAHIIRACTHHPYWLLPHLRKLAAFIAACCTPPSRPKPCARCAASRGSASTAVAASPAAKGCMYDACQARARVSLVPAASCGSCGSGAPG
jgi:hypothetical protein